MKLAFIFIIEQKIYAQHQYAFDSAQLNRLKYDTFVQPITNIHIYIYFPVCLYIHIYINPSTSLHMPHRKRQTNSISGVCALFYHSTASQFPTNSPHSTRPFTGLNKKSIRVNCIFICIEFSLPVRVLLFAFGFHTCPHSRQADLNMGSGMGMGMGTDMGMGNMSRVALTVFWQNARRPGATMPLPLPVPVAVSHWIWSADSLTRPSRNACGKFSTFYVPWRQIKNWSKFGNCLTAVVRIPDPWHQHLVSSRFFK